MTWLEDKHNVDERRVVLVVVPLTNRSKGSPAIYSPSFGIPQTVTSPGAGLYPNPH